MSKKIRPIKNTILMIVLTSTAGYLFGVIMVVLLGFGYQGTIIYISLFSVCTFYNAVRFL